MKANWVKYSVPLTSEANKKWAKQFLKDGSDFGKALEEVFDAELVKMKLFSRQDILTKLPDTFDFMCAPENKDRLVHALMACQQEYSKRGGVYSALRVKEFCKEVKKLPALPPNNLTP